MTDPIALLAALRRPKLLIRAARFGLTEYNRDRVLRRLMHSAATPSPVKAVDCLIVEEARLEETRKTGEASYSVARHVEVLIALIAEARLLPRPATRA